MRLNAFGQRPQGWSRRRGHFHSRKIAQAGAFQRLEPLAKLADQAISEPAGVFEFRIAAWHV